MRKPTESQVLAVQQLMDRYIDSYQLGHRRSPPVVRITHLQSVSSGYTSADTYRGIPVLVGGIRSFVEQPHVRSN